MIPQPTNPPALSLGDAIASVETAQNSLVNADTAQAQAQQKYEVAVAAKQLADAASADAVASFNAALDSLIAVATASKVNRASALSSSIK
jgi:hypothetical protein